MTCVRPSSSTVMRPLYEAMPSVVTGDNERKLFVVREIAPEVSSAEQEREES